MAENTTIDDLKAPLLAALGAADLALATVNDLLVELRERAEETRTDTRSRVEESRARLTKLQEELPEQLASSFASCASGSPLTSCAAPRKAMSRRRPIGTTSWSSAVRLLSSGCAARPASTTRRRVPRATSTRRSS